MTSLDHVYLPGTGSPPSAPAAAAEHLNHGGFRGSGSLAVVFLAPIGISSASGPPERVIAVVLGWHDGDHARVREFSSGCLCSAVWLGVVFEGDLDGLFVGAADGGECDGAACCGLECVE